jgi:rhodanese-related sulfurtransferase
MVIDLRTEAERKRKPHPSDVQVEVPLPPLSAEVMCWMAKTLTFLASETQGEISVFCARGTRSRLATAMLRASGHSVRDLGGIG